MYHKSVIENNPLQTYASALMCSPARSLIRDLFEKELKMIIIKPALSEEWGACLQTLEGHGDSVWSVAFSHDSTRLASASHDGTVKIWDAGSGACLQTLEIGKALFQILFDNTSSYLRTEISTIAINISSAISLRPSTADS
jgi:WD40 repeat protein